MDFKLFGLKLGPQQKPLSSAEDKKIKRSFVLPQTDDDAVTIEAVGGFYGQYVDMDGTTRNDNELIYKYREMSMNAECEAAIDDIICEAIVTEDNQLPVKLILDEIEDIEESTKKKIIEEFVSILKLLQFQQKGYEIFRRWYVDGKLIYHIIVDDKSKDKGIIELRYVDPVNIQKVKQYKKELTPEGVRIITSVEEYFVYNKDGFRAGNATGLRISPDAICYVTSGLFDSRNKRTVGYLHKAIKPLNQLRMMEDAVVIYRLCLVGDTRIKTPNGYKYIKDIKNGDTVYSFDVGGLFESKVKNAWSNGTKDVYRVRSTHHEIIGTDNHPILVYDAIHNDVSYVDIKNIDPDIHYFVYEKPQSVSENIPFNYVQKDYVKLTNYPIFSNLLIENKEQKIKDLAKKIRIKKTTVRNFLYGSQFVDIDTSTTILDEFGLTSKAKFETKKAYGNRNPISIPEYVTPDFAKLFGFLLGDGSFSKHTITFAEGIDNEQNQRYANLMIKFFGNCRRQGTKRKYSNWTTVNTEGSELLRSMGFVNGSKIKRIPEWVYRASEEIKAAFVIGLCEADGHIKIDQRKSLWTCTLSLANKNLIEDVKELWTDLGFCSGQISYRKRVAQTRIIGDEKEPRTMPETESWSLYLSTHQLTHFESINSIEHVGQEEVFDIEVDSEKHNFVANGVVVHNSRAPERRIFYIDVGNLPKQKAEQYLRELMNRHRNKLMYDATSGEVRDDRRHLSMLEDYWLPRREGGKGTEITTLPGAQNLSELDDVKYFQKKMYKSMGVPLSRMDGEQKSFSIGKSTEITRDEIKFGKFISRLRNKFSEMFYHLLKTQLLLKNIVTEEDWEEMKFKIFFDFLKDTYFSELKQNEITTEKMNVLTLMEPYIGRFYSEAWIKKNVLSMNEEDIKIMQKEMDEEKAEKEKEREEEMLKNPMMNPDLQNQDLGAAENPMDAENGGGNPENGMEKKPQNFGNKPKPPLPRKPFAPRAHKPKIKPPTRQVPEL